MSSTPAGGGGDAGGVGVVLALVPVVITLITQAKDTREGKAQGRVG